MRYRSILRDGCLEGRRIVVTGTLRHREVLRAVAREAPARDEC